MAGPRALRGSTALAALLLAACTVGAPAAAPSTSDSVSAGPSAAASGTPSTGGLPGSPSGTAGAGASPAATPTPVPRRSRLLQLVDTVRIPLAGQTYGRGLVTWGRYAAWVGCNGCQKTFAEPGVLYVADVTARTVRAVATLPASGGTLIPLGGAGQRFAYAVWSRRGAGADWTLQTLDLASGERTVLARAALAADGVPPAAVVGSGQVAWQTFPRRSTPGSVHGPVTTVDLRTGARRTAVRDLAGLLAGVTRSGVVYRAVGSADDAGPGLGGIELLRPGRRQALPLSGASDVADLVVDDSTLAWQTVEGSGAALWAVPLDGTRAPRQFYRGGTGDRAVGTGFVALVTTGDYPVLLMYALAGGPVVAVGDVPGEFDAIAAEGPRLAYIALPGERGVQPDARHPITLVVATVRLPAR